MKLVFVVFQSQGLPKCIETKVKLFLKKQKRVDF